MIINGGSNFKEIFRKAQLAFLLSYSHYSIHTEIEKEAIFSQDVAKEGRQLSGIHYVHLTISNATISGTS